MLQMVLLLSRSPGQSVVCSRDDALDGGTKFNHHVTILSFSSASTWPGSRTKFSPSTYTVHSDSSCYSAHLTAPFQSTHTPPGQVPLPTMVPTDARFARLQTDPRFRKPKQKNLKVEIDERFRDVLESEEFGGGGKQAKAAGKGKGRAGTSIHLII